MTEQPHRNQVASGPEVVLHEQRLQIGTERVAVERILLRKVIVTETRQVEVTVRREELHIERVPADPAVPSGRSEPAIGPLVIVLAQEVPVIQLHTQPYETVRVHLDTVTEQQQVTQTLSSERADYSTAGPCTAAPGADVTSAHP